jgi:hypothetical protein
VRQRFDVTGWLPVWGGLQKNRRQRRRLVTSLLPAMGHFITGVADLDLELVDLQSILAVA